MRLNFLTALEALCADSMKVLTTNGCSPDYVAIRRQSDLQTPKPGDALVVLAAAQLGTTRLIDNFEV
jgi:pantoate--beta-alanine ligase